MPSLKEQLFSDNKRRDVISDAERVLDQEVDDKSGLSGLAVKGAYKLVQSVKPGFIPEVIDALLDEFMDALDPLYQSAVAEGQPPGAYLTARRSDVAQALLGVTDRRAEKAQRAAIRKAYEKLRPTAQRHVEAAVPRLGQMLERHVAAPV
jgi:hypothetical protein